MGKVGNILLLLVIIEFALIMFTGTGTPEGDPTSVGNESSSSLLTMMVSPQEYLNLSLYSAMNLIFMLVGAFTIIVGSYFIRNEWVAYAGITAVFFSFFLTLVHFHQYMTAQGVWGGSDGIIISLLMAPIIILFIVTLLDFSRGKD